MPAVSNSDGPSAEQHIKKRVVAMHVAYVGTGYRGLQMTTEEPLASIEGVLEEALFRAGLVSPQNHGNLLKLRWKRSSRTDKGVHSLCTVIYLKMLLDEGRFVADPEGSWLAAQIRRWLPPQVDVLSVQRVPQSFDPRRFCTYRTYHYYLPVHLLLPSSARAAISSSPPSGHQQQPSLLPDPGSPAASTTPAPPSPGLSSRLTTGGSNSGAGTQEVQAAVGRLKEALSVFVGRHAFHNYAGRRKQYRQSRRLGAGGRSRREASQHSVPHASAARTPASADSTVEDSTLGAASRGDGTDGGSPVKLEAALASSEDEEDLDDLEDGEMELQGDLDLQAASEEAVGEGGAVMAGGEPGVGRWQQTIVFHGGEGFAEGDRVVGAHYRTMKRVHCSGVVQLRPGGVPCVRVEIEGASFMLHQIRHMIGAAAAVARGVLPAELLPVSVSAPARMAVPRAPPHCLLLADSEFGRFYREGEAATPVTALTGDRLQLREAGQAAQERFKSEVLNGALEQLLRHPDWEAWGATLDRYYYPSDQVEAALQAYSVWRHLMQTRQQDAAGQQQREASRVGLSLRKLLRKLPELGALQKADLRVGRILEAKLLDGSQTLLLCQVDLGDGIVKQSVMGLGAFYTPADLQGRHVVAIANPKHAKLLGHVSNTVVLAAVARSGGQQPSHILLATPAGPATPGTRVGWEVPQPAARSSAGAADAEPSGSSAGVQPAVGSSGGGDASGAQAAGNTQRKAVVQLLGASAEVVNAAQVAKLLSRLQVVGQDGIVCYAGGRLVDEAGVAVQVAGMHALPQGTVVGFECG